MTTYSTLGRTAIGINQPPGGSDYPFVRPSEDVRQLLADLFLSYQDNPADWVRPFRIQWLYGFGTAAVNPLPITPQHACDLLIVDANNVTVFDSRSATYATADWNDRFTLHTWQATAGDLLNVAAYSTWTDRDTRIDFPIYLAPISSQLDDRTLVRTPWQLRQLGIHNDAVTTVLSDTGLTFAGGLNMTVLPTVDATNEIRPTTVITFAAVPGSGLGRYDASCEDTQQQLCSINGQHSDDTGNIYIDTEACTRLQRPLTSEGSVTPAALELVDDCSVCCTCDSYIAVFEAYRRLHTRLGESISRINTLRTRYMHNVQAYTTNQTCRLANKTRMALESECPNRIALAAGFCNTTANCLTNVVLKVSFAAAGYSGVTPTIAPNSSYRGGNVAPATGLPRQPANTKHYTVGGTYPDYWAFFDQIPASTTGYVTWREVFADATAGTQVTLSVQAWQATTGSSGDTCPPLSNSLDSAIFASASLDGVINDSDCI